jgi:hypothetical protein
MRFAKCSQFWMYMNNVLIIILRGVVGLLIGLL